MFELHAWFQLSHDAFESDQVAIDAALPAIRAAVEALDESNSATTKACLLPRNGTYYVTVVIDANRRRYEAELLDRLVAVIAETLPGSYGLIYERDDEAIPPDFRVRRLARGLVTDHDESLLSPAVPTIEDA